MSSAYPTASSLRVLTVHYNTPEFTSRLIGAMPAKTPRGRDLIIHVLDNSSTPDNVARLEAHVNIARNATLTKSSVNVGFGEGVNRLFEIYAAASAKDIVWILNPDTKVDPGCILELEKELDSESRYAIVSPLIYCGDGSDLWIWYCGGSIGMPHLRVQHELYGRPPTEAPSSPFETEFITGAAPMMFAESFRSVGGFPTGYFLYWEDVYFSWRARQMGLRLGVVPSAHLWHAVGASSGFGQSETFYYWFARNRFKFAYDIGIPRSRLLSGRGVVETVRPAFRSIREKSGKISKLNAALRGIRDGSALGSINSP